MPDGRTLNITIPAGVQDRQMLRLRGQGLPGYGGGSNGDAYVEIHVSAHPVFTRKDSDVFIDLPIGLSEAVLGGSVEAPTITGPVTLTIPKGANSGARLRLKNKGFPQGGGAERGHQYVTLTIKLPDEIDTELETFVAEWAPKHEYDPRRATKSRAST
jgi:DnaJ-class molecular chaperone